MDDIIAFASFLILAVLVIAGLGYVAVNAVEADREKFMSMCVAERHTPFECEYMYRTSSSKDSTTVVPMPVVVSR